MFFFIYLNVFKYHIVLVINSSIKNYPEIYDLEQQTLIKSVSVSQGFESSLAEVQHLS